MKVLAIETSTTACSLGLRIDGETVEQTTQLGRNHSREILPLISGLLAETAIDLRALDLIVYGKGPGSFTGLRIALGVVRLGLWRWHSCCGDIDPGLLCPGSVSYVWR